MGLYAKVDKCNDVRSFVAKGEAQGRLPRAGTILHRHPLQQGRKRGSMRCQVADGNEISDHRRRLSPPEALGSAESMGKQRRLELHCADGEEVEAVDEDE
ncbi:hypothetical protein BHE74_00044728 [Ensete ventricosum]|nr:hypothetical protein BHE74_00044728 [Ensete ventricosum]